jgi:nitroreductase
MVLTSVLLAALLSATPPTLELPPAQKIGGTPLMEALAKRSSGRAYVPNKALSLQQLSNLLWAAFGVNRADGKRTAGTAANRQEVDIYVLLPQGAYLYDARKHALTPVVDDDLRSVGTSQQYVKDAPLTLLFVSDLSKMTEGSTPQKQATTSFAVGAISQNVYLWSASEGLATCVRAWIDRSLLMQRLGLEGDQYIVAAQSVGYPK